jgi:polyisoprenoid-binding protein YceI
MKAVIARIFAALALAAAPASFAETQTTWDGTSEIKFSGTSTLHNWSGKVTAEPFIATVVMESDTQPKSLKARVEVQAAKMDTDKKKRDDNMHADMKVTKYPLIIGEMNTAFEKIMPNGRAPTKLPFTLTIMGKPQAVNGSITDWSLKGNTATFDLDFELSLKKCDIEVPSVLLFINVGDTIKLHAPVKLVRRGN